MPFSLIPGPRGVRGAGEETFFPFKVSKISVDINNTSNFWGKSDINCGCPATILSTGKQYTSSKSFLPLSQSTGSNPNKNTKQGIIVSLDSYLFKGLNFNMVDIASMQSKTNGNQSPQSISQNDPYIKIYGLNFPIIIEDFINKNDAKSTMKIFLTCCYSSRETTISGTAFGAPCQSAITDTYVREELKPDNPKSLPQIAFISADTDWPEKMAVTKIIDRSTNPTRPLIDRRIVELHIPLAEVDKDGNVLAQYLRSNLSLSDVCLNGIPVKMPLSLASEGPIYVSKYKPNTA